MLERQQLCVARRKAHEASMTAVFGGKAK